MDVGLGLLSATKMELAATDPAMSVSQVSIQRQRPLAFGNPLGCAECENIHHAQIHVGLRVLWSHRQSLVQGRLGRREGRGSFVGKEVNAHGVVNYGRADQCFDTAGIKRQSAFEKAARLRQVLDDHSLV